MQPSKRYPLDVVVRRPVGPAGPALDGSNGSMIGAPTGPPRGELRSYLRDLALGRR